MRELDIVDVRPRPPGRASVPGQVARERRLADQTLPEMPLLIDVMRKAAGEHVAAATKLPAGGNTELVTAREKFEAARSEWMRLDGERIRIETSIPIEERVLSEIQGELPGLSFKGRGGKSDLSHM
jgi:hypothetical protein